MGGNPAGLSSNDMEIIPMTIRKVKGLESDFTIVPNKTINDKLSWAARGMLLYLCSKPDDWEVNITDLVNQTTGSKKKSGRDAVRAIMDELVECGYMRKSQDRNIKGQFKNADHEVSFMPFTENPYAVQADSAQPTQQSKDLTKEGINKVSNTDIFSGKQKETYFINELCRENYWCCHEAMRSINSIRDVESVVYNGSLTMDEWHECEIQMRYVSEMDFAGYFSWWVEKYSNSFAKKASLPNMVCDVNGIEFDRFYDSTYLQEAD